MDQTFEETTATETEHRATIGELFTDDSGERSVAKDMVGQHDPVDGEETSDIDQGLPPAAHCQ